MGIAAAVVNVFSFVTQIYLQDDMMYMKKYLTINIKRRSQEANSTERNGQYKKKKN